MTTATTAIEKQAPATHYDFFACFARRKPALIGNRFHHDDTTDHSGMLGPAILRTKNVIIAELCRLKPFACIFSRYDILLQSKSRYKKAMNDVLRGHG